MRGLSISQVAIYQGIKIPIMKDGEAAERPTNPVVQGRAAMVTVFVTPTNEWRARTVKAFLEIYRGDGEVPAEFSGSGAGCGVVVIWTRATP